MSIEFVKEWIKAFMEHIGYGLSWEAYEDYLISIGFDPEHAKREVAEAKVRVDLL